MYDLYQNLIVLLQKSEVKFEIINHNPIQNTAEGINELNIPIEQTLKTLAFLIDKQYVFLTFQGNKRIDYKKLAQALFVDRKSISMMSREIVEDKLGYQIGGLSPLHINDSINVYFDIGVSALDDVYAGIGVNNKTLKISACSLLDISEAKLADFTKDLI